MKPFISRSSSVLQVWISYAKFELSLDDPERLHKCRQVFEEANKSMRHCEVKEERLLLLESWRDFEREFGTDAAMERVRKLLPEKVKKRRKLTADDGVRSLSAALNFHCGQSYFITETLQLYSALEGERVRFQNKTTVCQQWILINDNVDNII